MLQAPTASGLTLCEKVIIEEGTRNATLVNSIIHLRVRTFPSPLMRFVVSAVLSDGIGEATMSLIVSRLDTLEDINERHWQMRFPDPLHVVRLRLRSPFLSFPAPGRYEFALLADGDRVAQMVLKVTT
jgi:hypothetical protein